MTDPQFRISLAEGAHVGGKERRERIMNFLRFYIGKHHRAPSYKEIGDAVGLQTRASVWTHIHALEKQGLLTLKPGQPRAIFLTEHVQTWAYEDMQPPLVGYVARRLVRTVFVPTLKSTAKENGHVGMMLDTLKEENDIVIVPTVLNGHLIGILKRRGFKREMHFDPASNAHFECYAWRRPETEETDESV